LTDKERTLNRSAVKAYYDRFGEKQDTQGFYENPALDDLTAAIDFREIRNVFEFGCGTGLFAARLLETYLSASANYLGFDISPVMVGIAKSRLKAFGERARVSLSDGEIRFPCLDASVDCVLSTYVLDLLPEADIERVFSEAHRILVPGGKFCLVSLTGGTTLPSRLVATLWTAVFRMSPALVGGCRPIRLDSFAAAQQWDIVHKKIVTPFGVPSEVLILAAKKSPGH